MGVVTLLLKVLLLLLLLLIALLLACGELKAISLYLPVSPHISLYLPSAGLWPAWRARSS